MDDHTKPLEKQDNDNNVKFLLTLLNLELMSSSWILQKGKYTIGRLSSHQVILDDVTVSRNHASIEIINEEVKIYDNKNEKFVTEKGPVFSNLILADEINRAPPKVQSALLEAMQERQVSIHGDTFEIEKPFLVLATQNPIESEGTYRLPEAQIDRFALKLIINYPSKDHEKLIIQRNTQENKPTAKNIVSKDVILEIQKFVQKIYADEKIEEYVSAIVDATRNPKNYDLELEDMIEFGASPRASIWLILAAKAHALLAGRGFVIPDDIKSVAHDVLRHRIILTFEAEAEGNTSDAMIDKILEKVRAP